MPDTVSSAMSALPSVMVAHLSIVAVPQASCVLPCTFTIGAERVHYGAMPPRASDNKWHRSASLKVVRFSRSVAR